MTIYLLQLGAYACIYAILAVSLNYVSGFTGMISLAHGAFFGVGAYAGAMMLLGGSGFLLALLVAVGATALLALLTSIPLLRVRKDSFMLVTLGFAIIYEHVMLNWTSLTGGALGMKGIPLASFVPARPELARQLASFSLAAGALALTLLAFWWILSGPYGTILKGIREDEDVVRHFGHRTMRYKRSAIVVSAAFAGLAGAVFAPYIGYIDPVLFGLPVGFLILTMAIIGGLGNLWGGLAGAVLLYILQDAVRFLPVSPEHVGELRQIVYGALLVVTLYFRPQGLFGSYRLR